MAEPLLPGGSGRSSIYARAHENVPIELYGEKGEGSSEDQVDRLPAWLSGSCAFYYSTHSSRRIGCGPSSDRHWRLASVDRSPSSPANAFRCADLVDFISTGRTGAIPGYFLDALVGRIGQQSSPYGTGGR